MAGMNDVDVRVQIYRDFLRTGRAPTAASLAHSMNAPADEVQASIERLAAGRAISLQPVSREILYAAPLSAVPNPFLVRIAGLPFFAACIWDALGIIAMVKQETAVETSCPCCGEAMQVAVRGGRLASSEGIIHFGLPAKRWWDNIAFT